MLFNSLLDKVVQLSITGHDADGMNFWGVVLAFLIYADDIVLVSETRIGLDRQLQRLNDACRRFGLTINVAKTKTMTVRRTQTAADRPISVNGQELEDVDGYCYLGSWISADGSLEREISNRISRASATFARVPQRIALAVRVNVYRSVVVSALLYGAETWPISTLQLQRLESFQNRCLQRILGLTLLDRVRVTVIRRRCLDQQKIQTLIQQARLRWLGHVFRRPHRLPCRIMEAKPPRGSKRPPGRPRLRWTDLVQRDLDQRGVDWETARQRAVHWLSL